MTNKFKAFLLNHVPMARALWDSIKPFVYSNNLSKLGKVYGTDKGDEWHTYANLTYLDIYGRYLKDLKQTDINLLEIGVLDGASLRMWKKFFPRARIFGLDIDPNAKQYEEDRIAIFVGSQTDESTLEKLVREAEYFDIIIDDGSHVNKHIIKTYGYLFKYLRSGGFYIVEDLGTSYELLEQIDIGNGRKGVRELWPGMQHNDPEENLNNSRQDMDNFFNQMIHGLDRRNGEILFAHFWSCLAIIKKA